MNVDIVGGGIFGQVIAKYLRYLGAFVTVYDDRNPLAGSPPSGGHIKASWLEKVMDSEDLEFATRLLNKFYGVERLICDYNGKDVELFRVDVESVLSSPTVEAHVLSVENGKLIYKEPTGGPVHVSNTNVIVAAGFWSGQLLPQIQPELKGKQGMSFVFEGVEENTNLIHPWCPYKQIIRTDHGPGKVWMGDGTAIIPANWGKSTEEKITKRVMPFAPKKNHTMHIYKGIRPYMANGCRQLDAHLWVATGAGKSGMALSAVYAKRIAEDLGLVKKGTIAL